MKFLRIVFYRMFWLFWIYLLVTPAYATNDPSVNGTWKFFLPDNYSKSEPPRKNGLPVDVYIKLKILDIEEINENKMYFVMNCVMLDIWKDHRLLVETAPYDYPYKFTIDGYKKIWKPDITFENSKAGNLFPISVPNVVIQLQKDTSLYRQSRYSLVIGCFMRFHLFPMDTQHCEFVLSFFASIDAMAVLHWVAEPSSPYKRFGPSIEVAPGIDPLQFHLMKPKTLKRTVKRPLGIYTQLIGNFTFARRLTGNIVNTYIPSGLIVILSWVSFWLDVNAVPGRVTLGVTSILTLSTTVVQSRNDVQVNYLRAIDVWLLLCLVMVFASLIEYAASYHFACMKSAKSEESKEEQDQKQHLLKPQMNSKFASQKDNMIQNSQESLPDSDLINLKRSKDAKSSDQGTQEIPKPDVLFTALDHYSRVAFPIAFLCCTISYWGYYLPFMETET